MNQKKLIIKLLDAQRDHQYLYKDREKQKSEAVVVGKLVDVEHDQAKNPANRCKE